MGAGMAFISVCLETRCLGNFGGFYVQGWPCTHIHACIDTKAYILGDLWVLLVQKSLKPQPSTNYFTRLFSKKPFVKIFSVYLYEALYPLNIRKGSSSTYNHTWYSIKALNPRASHNLFTRYGIRDDVKLARWVRARDFPFRGCRFDRLILTVGLSNK